MNAIAVIVTLSVGVAGAAIYLQLVADNRRTFDQRVRSGIERRLRKHGASDELVRRALAAHDVRRTTRTP
jgi:hypothetical protein